MIRLRGLSRDFPVGDQIVHALRAVDIAIGRGEFVAIMGPSGSGKSTLLNLLGLLDKPSAGSYELDGHDVTELSEAETARVRRDKIGFVFQFFHLVPRLSAAANVALPMLLAGVAPKERKQRVEKLLADVGLSDRADHRPAQLSGGQLQRVAIARAMSMNPALLLADEPTGNLDRATGREIMSLLEDLNRAGTTLVVITHDAEIGARAARRIVMEDGRVLGDEHSSAADRPSPPAPLCADGTSLAALGTATSLRPAPSGLVPLAGEGSGA